MRYGRIPTLALLALLLPAASGCDNMASQPRDKTWRPASALPDRKVWPPVPPANGIALDDVAKPVPPLSPALLARGRERYEIYCAACHGFTGEADGMVVRRGFPSPPSFHSDRLRQAPTRHFYDVATQGWGAMYSYADRVSADDRWAIVAYIRALQESRHVTAASLPDEIRQRLK